MRVAFPPTRTFVQPRVATALRELGGRGDTEVGNK
jgi:hypothetical protein